MALALLRLVPTMMISAPLPTEVPNLLPSDATPPQTSTEVDGSNFSALLLMFLVAPPVQDSALGVNEQLSGVAVGSISQFGQEIPDAVSGVGAGDTSVFAECSKLLIETEAALPWQNDLPLNFDPKPNPLPTGLAVEQNNTEREDGTVLFQDHLNPGVTYAGEAAEVMGKSAVAGEILAGGESKTGVTFSHDVGRLLPHRPTAEIASFNRKPDDSVQFGISNSDPLIAASSSAAPRGWQFTTVQEANLTSVDATGKKNLGEEMKASQDPLAQNPDLFLPFSSVARRVEEGVKASDPTTANEWTPVINRVAGEIISSVRHNKHEAFITLEPPELGNIRISISLEGEKVHARILAEVHDSRRLIENHAADLKQALQLQNLDLVDLRVDSGNWSGARDDHGQSFRQDFHRQQEFPDGNTGFLSSNRTVDGGETQGANSVIAANGRVSLWA